MWNVCLLFNKHMVIIDSILVYYQGLKSELLLIWFHELPERFTLLSK